MSGEFQVSRPGTLAANESAGLIIRALADERYPVGGTARNTLITERPNIGATYSVSVWPLELEVEPRSQLLLIDALRLGMTINMLMFDPGFAVAVSGSDLLLFDPGFKGLRPADMLLFDPIRPMFDPHMINVDAVAAFNVRGDIDATRRGQWAINDLPVDGYVKHVVDFAAYLSRGGTVGQIDGVAMFSTREQLTAYLQRERTDVYAYAQTILDTIVTVEPHGGVLEAYLHALCGYNTRAHLAGYSRGIPAVDVTGYTRTQNEAIFTAVVEAT